ncbi:unnamed protein product, partial [Rotaria sp. Silwood1]
VHLNVVLFLAISTS